MNPKQLAAQLRCPNGDQSAQVATGMNEANLSVNRKCLQALAIQPGDKVLEIGPGNGAFVGQVLAQADGVNYSGVDWSHDMIAAATQLNDDVIRQGRAAFWQGSSDNLPFADAQFSKAFSVHTLYFWQHPREHLAEIRRVLQTGSRLCLAFGERDFMQGLPFTAFGFRLYHHTEVSDLLAAAGFRVLQLQQQRETGRSNTGDMIEKVVNILLAELP